MTPLNLQTPSAEELFRLTDDGAGGWLQTAKRRLKFRLRHRLCRDQLEEIRRFLWVAGWRRSHNQSCL